ncbi:trp operon repressor [Xylella fastidiosa]|uniref:trp operon repressor n=1 Tax=Xylella fastidiosa TaxID=2371 RepID=UPI001120F7A2|nr:trp operon repressor [Xylella fastidiosa]TNW23296.1 trp operon repressor [Xylella fastidiosa subsp. pauca]
MSREQAFEMLIKILCKTDSTDDMKLILECILTRSEMEDLIDRIRIYNELLNTRNSQREVASKLGVSITKITRGAANLQDNNIKDFLRKKISY